MKAQYLLTFILLGILTVQVHSRHHRTAYALTGTHLRQDTDGTPADVETPVGAEPVATPDASEAETAAQTQDEITTEAGAGAGPEPEAAPEVNPEAEAEAEAESQAAAEVAAGAEEQAEAQTVAGANTPVDIRPLAVIASLFQYYLDDKIFTNILHLSFSGVDTDRDGAITKEEYHRAFEAEGIPTEDTDRLWDLVQRENPDTLEFVEFKDLSEIVYHETLSILTFSFIMGGPQHSPVDGVDIEQLKSGFSLIFQQLTQGYPMPRCEDLEFLFNECDVDGDGKLNVKEFFFVASIYLRFYKGGIENNRYASLILQDNLIDLLWLKEKLIAEHEARLRAYRISFFRFFQMAVFEKVLQEVAHVLFSRTDVDNSGKLNFEEFYQALSVFGISAEEARLLYALADTNSEGDLDFGEFVSVFETFVHRAVAKFGFLYIQELAIPVNINATYTLFYKVITHVGLQPLSDDAFETLFKTMDADGSGTLNADEFAKLSSGIISYLKTKIRDDINKKLESSSGIQADETNINQAVENKTQVETPALHSEVANEIIGSVEQGALKADENSIEKAIADGDIPQSTAGQGIPFETPAAEAAAEAAAVTEIAAEAAAETPAEATEDAENTAEAIAEAAATTEATAETPAEAAAATETAAETTAEAAAATEIAAESTAEAAAATEAAAGETTPETPAEAAAATEAAAEAIAQAAAAGETTPEAAAEAIAQAAAAGETTPEAAAEAIAQAAAAGETTPEAATEATAQAAAAGETTPETPAEAAAAATETAAQTTAQAAAAGETTPETPAEAAAATQTAAETTGQAAAAAGETTPETPAEAAAATETAAETTAQAAAATETAAETTAQAAAATEAAAETPAEGTTSAEVAATAQTPAGTAEVSTEPAAAAAAGFAEITSNRRSSPSEMVFIQEQISNVVQN